MRSETIWDHGFRAAVCYDGQAPAEFAAEAFIVAALEQLGLDPTSTNIRLYGNGWFAGRQAARQTVHTL